MTAQTQSPSTWSTTRGLLLARGLGRDLMYSTTCVAAMAVSLVVGELTLASLALGPAVRRPMAPSAAVVALALGRLILQTILVLPEALRVAFHLALIAGLALVVLVRPSFAVALVGHLHGR